MHPHDTTIPIGICQCGCGLPTRYDRSTKQRRRFVWGHHECEPKPEPLRVRWRPISERFWSKVDKTPTCWLWTGARDKSGYGYVGVQPGYFQGAHRVAWALIHGPIPDGLYVLHRCPDPPNRLCVNPEHLYLGTARDNMDDVIRANRRTRHLKAIGSTPA